MKILIIFAFFSLKANDVKEHIFFKDFELKSSDKYFEISKIVVNQACKNEEQKCLNFIKAELKKIKQKNKDELKGNPASELCFNLKGKSFIYYDKDHNEYDFCKLNAYEFNSWDIYYNLKK